MSSGFGPVAVCLLFLLLAVGAAADRMQWPLRSAVPCSEPEKHCLTRGLLLDPSTGQCVQWGPNGRCSDGKISLDYEAMCSGAGVRATCLQAEPCPTLLTRKGSVAQMHAAPDGGCRPRTCRPGEQLVPSLFPGLECARSPTVPPSPLVRQPPQSGQCLVPDFRSLSAGQTNSLPGPNIVSNPSSDGSVWTAPESPNQPPMSGGLAPLPNPNIISNPSSGGSDWTAPESPKQPSMSGGIAPLPGPNIVSNPSSGGSDWTAPGSSGGHMGAPGSGPEPVPGETFLCTRPQQNCFRQGLVWFRGRCSEALERGKCPAGRLVVLKRVGVRLRVICERAFSDDAAVRNGSSPCAAPADRAHCPCGRFTTVFGRQGCAQSRGQRYLFRLGLSGAGGCAVREDTVHSGQPLPVYWRW